MIHFIKTELGEVEIHPIFDVGNPTTYKCFLNNGGNCEIIVRGRDLHKVVGKMLDRMHNIKAQKEQTDKRLYFRYR